MRAVVTNIALDVIVDLIGKTIDIQGSGGMYLSEAAFELHEKEHVKKLEFEKVA